MLEKKAELTPSVQDDEQNEVEEKTVEAGKPATRSSEVLDKDNDKDSDESVKTPPKKKTKQNQILDSDDDNDDDGEDKSKIARRKRNLNLTPIQLKQRRKKRPRQLILHCQRGEIVQERGPQGESLICYRTKTKWFLMMKGWFSMILSLSTTSFLMVMG